MAVLSQQLGQPPGGIGTAEVGAGAECIKESAEFVDVAVLGQQLSQVPGGPRAGHSHRSYGDVPSLSWNSTRGSWSSPMPDGVQRRTGWLTGSCRRRAGPAP
jgi:hypothetical protein